MKKYITLIVLVINLFKLTYCMEDWSKENPSMDIDLQINENSQMDLDSQEEQSSNDQSFDIDGKKKYISASFDQVHTQAHLESCFERLITIFDDPYFNTNASISIRKELREFIIDQSSEFKKNTDPNLATDELKIALDKIIRNNKYLKPHLNDLLFDRITVGANPNLIISYKNREIPLLNYCIERYKIDNDQRIGEPLFINLIPCLLIHGAKLKFDGTIDDCLKWLFIALNKNVRLTSQFVRMFIIFEAFECKKIVNKHIIDFLPYWNYSNLPLFLGYDFTLHRILPGWSSLLFSNDIDAKTLKVLSMRIDVNVKDSNGLTTLYLTVLCSSALKNPRKVLKTLLKNGAIDHPNNLGKTARKLAEENNKLELVQIFEEYSKSAFNDKKQN